MGYIQKGHSLENNVNKKIVFMGTPQYATIILKELIDSDYDIIALFTQPDKKVGRNQLLTMPHIKQFSVDNNFDFPVYQPNSLREDGIVDILKDLNPDFIIVAAYGQILPQVILNIAPCINLHASLLPQYRGASPIQQSLLNNDKFAGVTAMMMEAGLDSGDILGYKYMEILPSMFIEDLFNFLAKLASKLTVEVLENYTLISPKKQNQSKVSYCHKITKDEGLIEFCDANFVYQKYKAYKIWPGIYLQSGLKIKECFVENGVKNYNAGEILKIKEDSIIVGCNRGSLAIYEVQAPSKKSLNVLDYIRGARLNIGDILS
jgi:methionyl-tRNA formyltransferase